APEELRVAEEPLPKRYPRARRARDLGVEHEAREVDRPAVRGRVRTVRVAEVAAEAEVDDAGVLGGGERRRVAVVALVGDVEERVEGRAEVVAAPAAGADVVDAPGLGGEGRRIERSGRPRRRPGAGLGAHGLTGRGSGGPSRTDRRGTSRPSPASRTTRRSPRSPRCAPSSRTRDTSR